GRAGDRQLPAARERAHARGRLRARQRRHQLRRRGSRRPRADDLRRDSEEALQHQPAVLVGRSLMDVGYARRGILALTLLCAVVLVAGLGALFFGSPDTAAGVPAWLIMGSALVVISG